MGTKLTNTIVDQRLIENNRPIKRTGDYVNNHTNIEWKCLETNCYCIWQAVPNSILNANKGCPKCAGNFRLTKEIVLERLKLRNIKLIEDYIAGIDRSYSNKKCICNKCGYGKNGEWKPCLSNIFYGYDCPLCSNNLPLTNKIIDQRLIDKNKKIKRIGNYLTMSIKIDWLCLICDYEWESTPGHILGTRGCPKCNKNIKLTNDIIDKRLIENNRKIKRIGQCVNKKTNIDWRCLDCDYIWSARPANILNKYTGCPQCTNCLPLTEKIVIERLSKVNIEFIDNYDQKDGVASNKKCKCKKCNYGENGEWRPKLNNVFKRHGCPMCSLNKNEKIMLSLLKTFDKDILSEHCLNKINKLARPLLFDAYSSKYNVAFEYDGVQHFEPIKFNKKISDEQALADLEERQINDEYKNNFCRENNIRLVRIDGRKYKDQLLSDYIKKLITSLI